MTHRVSLRSAARRFAAFAVAASVVAALATVPPAGALTFQGRPSLQQLEADLLASVGDRTPALGAAVPSLTAAMRATEGALPRACVVTAPGQGFPADAWRACAFGDRGAKRTIYLFGDDAAEMWIPALRTIGSVLHWRVVITVKEGCSPWGHGVRGIGLACGRFIDDELALANAEHPNVILPIGQKVRWYGDHAHSVRVLTRQITDLLADLFPSHARILLFQPVPTFVPGYTGTWNPTYCLTHAKGLLVPCERTIYNVSTTSTAAVATDDVAAQSHVTVIPVRELFCSGTRCALYVKTPGAPYLVYRDSARMNLFYSNWISRALATLLEPHLP